MELTCSVDANPLPTLSLWILDTADEETLMKEQNSPDVSLSLQMLLKKEHHKTKFFCKAVNEKYTKISTMVTYEIQCKYMYISTKITLVGHKF